MAFPGRSLLTYIGKTPLVSLGRVAPPGSAALCAKLESVNPSGSVKDRIVWAMVADAEERGLLQPGATLVEASSGNAGISLAAVAAARGYAVAIVLPENAPPERRRLLQRLGAQVHLTPAPLGMAGAQRHLRRLVEERGFVYLDVFRNPACVRAHREGTGRELLEQTGGRVDAFVAGVGTGSTLTGVAQALKAAGRQALVAAVEPAASPLLSQGRAGRHGIPGLGADFVPPLLERALVDEVLTVGDEEALETAARLAREEGLLVGPSSGANVAAALQVAQRLGPGRVVATVLPDGAERYPAVL